MRGVARITVTAGTAAAALTLVVPALAHLERPSYWPDPGPDKSVKPAAGGDVPKQRSLRSAVTGDGATEVRVACQGRNGKDSLRFLERSLDQARKRGFRIRPSQPKVVYSKKRSKSRLRLNRRLAKQCEYRSIQAAVRDSGNNGRVVIMPGYYTEPRSRKQPTNDPRCADLTQLDQGGARTPSFEYQATCPNDQNLIYVQGREVAGKPPSPPLDNRQGIPDEGPCKQCNLQIEGSGPNPADAVIDAGKGGSRRKPEAPVKEYVKDVVIRADRADGIVVTNLTVRGAQEHGIYVEETDGYLINEVKMLWNRDYGSLAFGSDHGLYKNCDGFGSGDALVYPGGAPETGKQADKSFYPDAPRINTVVKKCDLHGNVLAYSGSMGNAVRITRNHIYGNATGITTDSISAPGHPGFPQDSLEVDHNYIYSNNFNAYADSSPVDPLIGVPIGVGLFIAGGNNSSVHDNWFFDNWRRGTMLIAIPDAVAGEKEGSVNEGISCQNPQVTTSCANEYFDNVMGRPPEDFKPSKAVGKFGNPSNVGGAGEGEHLPNGVDFWWDEFPGNTENCWYDNVGVDGTRAGLTGDPAITPAEGGSLPQFLPEDCDSSVGTGDPVKEAVLADCGNVLGGDREETPLCDFYTPPPQPRSAAAQRAERDFEASSRRWLETDEADRVRARLDANEPAAPAGAYESLAHHP